MLQPVDRSTVHIWSSGSGCLWEMWIYFNLALLPVQQLLADKCGVNSGLTCFLLREALETKFGFPSRQ